MLYDLNGKIAFVVGTAQGLGEAVLRRFVEAGANVIGCDINKGKAHSQWQAS